jgi:hypothetical protein
MAFRKSIGRICLDCLHRDVVFWIAYLGIASWESRVAAFYLAPVEQHLPVGGMQEECTHSNRE